MRRLGFCFVAACVAIGCGGSEPETAMDGNDEETSHAGNPATGEPGPGDDPEGNAPPEGSGGQGNPGSGGTGTEPMPEAGAPGMETDPGGAGGMSSDPEEPLKPVEELEVVEFEIPELPGCAAPYPHDPAVDEATGLVYYADSNASCIGELNPETMEFRAWPTPTPDSYPHGLVVDDQSRVFYTGQRTNRIGRLIPETEVIEDFPVDAQAPHTPVFHLGDVWFTAQRSGQYGRFDRDAGTAEIFDFSDANTGPYGIWPAPDDSLWVALFGTNRLARIDPTGDLPTSEEFTLPNAASRPRRIAVDGRGRVWYTDYPRRMLGMMDPAAEETDQFLEWETPGGGRPYGIAIGPDDRVWYNDEDAPEMVGVDPETRMTVAQLLVATNNPGPVRNIAVDRVRKKIWLAISNVGRLGVIEF